MLSPSPVSLSMSAAVRRRVAGVSSASAAVTCARRGVSSQPNLLGLASTAMEAATLTARMAVTKRPVPAAAARREPLPPLWKLFRRSATATAAPAATVTRKSFIASAAASTTTTAAALSSAVVTSVFSMGSGSSALLTARRHHHHLATGFTASRTLLSPKQQDNQLQGVSSVERYREEEEERREEEQQEDPFTKSSGPGYLPFPPPFHTVNIIMILIIANALCYLLMNYGSDDTRDFIVEHFTLSHENFGRIYPIFTNALYQENLLQLLIDTWLLWQFGDSMLGFLGNVRLTFFAALCTLGGSLIHVARQKFELYYEMDELEVRGRCYGPNTMIMGIIAMEGLIFRHLNFIQQPPIPFLVLTAFVMVIDVWRIFTTKPEEHGASTGGALMAYLFWALPTRFLGLDKLTATL